MDTWGMLPKSQEDPSTVDDEIDALIAAHLADPDAHLEVGESLQSHKASEIIDHIAGSVVRDKLGFDRFIFDTAFETIDAWQQSAGVSLASIASVELATTNVTNNYQFLFTGYGSYGDYLGENEKNPIFETSIFLPSLANVLAYVCRGDVLSPCGCGFKLSGGNWYAFWYDDSYVEHTTNLGAASASVWYVLRCEYTDGGAVNWYINGTLVHTENNIEVNQDAICAMYYMIKTLTTTIKYLIVRDLHYDQDF